MMGGMNQMGGMGGYQARPMGGMGMGGPTGGMGSMGGRMMGPGGMMGGGPVGGSYSMGGMGPGPGPRMVGGPGGPGGARLGGPVSGSGPPPGHQAAMMSDTAGGPGMLNMTDGGTGQEGGAGGGPGPAQPPNTGKTTPTPGQNKEVNTSTVCRIGQETVEEIVSRTQEVFSILKSLQPPVGSYSKQTQQHDQSNLEKQTRLQDVLKGIGMLFKRLRVCWDKCQVSLVGLYGGILLIPLVHIYSIRQQSLFANQ